MAWSRAMDPPRRHGGWNGSCWCPPAPDDASPGPAMIRGVTRPARRRPGQVLPGRAAGPGTRARGGRATTGGMSTPLAGLGLDMPVIAAPMAGGASTPALVTAAALAGGLGFLAAGYKTPQALAGQIAEVRSAGLPFGVNLFAPNPVPADLGAYRRYARAIQPEADRYGLDLAGDDPAEDDDHWAEKVALLTADPVPLVSFTFGIPEPGRDRGPPPGRVTGRADRDVGGGGSRRRRRPGRSAGRAGLGGGRALRHAHPGAPPGAGPAGHADRPGPRRDHGAAAGGGRARRARRCRRGLPGGGGRRRRRHRAAPGRRERRFPGPPGRAGRPTPRHDRHPGLHRGLARASATCSPTATTWSRPRGTRPSTT